MEPSTSERKPRAISLDRIQRSFVKATKKRVLREASVERNPDLFNRTVSQLVSPDTSGYQTPPTAIHKMEDLGDQNTRLKTFNGTTDVKEFIKRFNIVTAAKGVTDDGKKATWIPVFLTGPATLSTETKKTAADTLKAIETQFTSLENTNFQLQRLHSMRQKDGESVTDLTTRYLKGMSSLYGCLEQTAVDSQEPGGM